MPADDPRTRSGSTSILALSAGRGCVRSPVPCIGIVGSSGSGKTTLIEALLPRLAARDLRVAVVKHARAGIEFDRPGKDSHRVREAGAVQVVVASGNRWMIAGVADGPVREPSLEVLLERLDTRAIDAILVEGFHHEMYPKIEVYRPAHGRPVQCWPSDPNVVALATDVPIPSSPVPVLDLNNLDAIAAFAIARLAGARGCARDGARDGAPMAKAI